ncbi:MAG: anaerobic sulfatase maturase [Clostridia bacterium]|nr:anaerobic sulfatase maturase [Clostridia bacterium]
MIKPASGLCNLRCKYCFYRSLSDHLTGEAEVMSGDTMRKMVDRVFEEDPSQLTLAFQGGEPTLAGLGYFRALVNYVEKKNEKKIPVQYTIQTNGMLLDVEWADFLREHHFLVGLSLDGTQEIHDSLRPRPDDKGSFQQVMRSAELLRRYNVDFNILCVVTNRLARRAEAVYSFFKKNDFKYIQFIPCLDEFGETPAESFAPAAKRFGEFYLRIFEQWYRDFMAGDYVSIRWFDNLIHMAQGEAPELCGCMGYCPGQLVIEGDGSVYPCDFYVSDVFRLGNLHDMSFTEMIQSETMSRFVEKSFEHEKECEACDYRYLCRGGCRRDRQNEVDGDIGKSRFCEGYRIFFARFMPRLESIMQKLSRWNMDERK